MVRHWSTYSKIISPEFFFVESDGDYPTSSFELKLGQTNSEKLARASFCAAVVPL